MTIAITAYFFAENDYRSESFFSQTNEAKRLSFSTLVSTNRKIVAKIKKRIVHALAVFKCFLTFKNIFNKQLRTLYFNLIIKEQFKI